MASLKFWGIEKITLFIQRWRHFQQTPPQICLLDFYPDTTEPFGLNEEMNLPRFLYYCILPVYTDHMYSCVISI